MRGTDVKSAAPSDPSIIVTEANGTTTEDNVTFVEEETGELKDEESCKEVANKEIWMDFADFCKCFK